MENKAKGAASAPGVPDAATSVHAALQSLLTGGAQVQPSCSSLHHCEHLHTVGTYASGRCVLASGASGVQAMTRALPPRSKPGVLSAACSQTALQCVQNGAWSRPSASLQLPYSEAEHRAFQVRAAGVHQPPALPAPPQTRARAQADCHRGPGTPGACFACHPGRHNPWRPASPLHTRKRVRTDACTPAALGSHRPGASACTLPTTCTTAGFHGHVRGPRRAAAAAGGTAAGRGLAPRGAGGAVRRRARAGRGRGRRAAVSRAAARAGGAARSGAAAPERPCTGQGQASAQWYMLCKACHDRCAGLTMSVEGVMQCRVAEQAQLLTSRLVTGYLFICTGHMHKAHAQDATV